MDVLLDSLAQRGPALLLVLTVALFLLTIAVVVLARAHQKTRRKWASLVRDAQNEGIEAMLVAHLEERQRLAAEVAALLARVEELETKGKSAKRHVGLVRFDAFEDVGGSQSFALAVLDDLGDGAVLTSIVGRDSCRIYAKPLVGGRSERDLSGEEQRAVREAVASGPRSIVSG